MSESADELVLEGEELLAEGPVLEEGMGRVHVPAKGKLFADDGSVQVAIIRPCVSRGKRLRGLPPIYEPGMLGRNAGVFEGWHMWMGHLSEGLREAVEGLEDQLREAALNRNIARDLGGRVIGTWYDPTYQGKDDDSFGYRPGATMGKVIPYPASKAILECDPGGLHVSIAAWPTSARKAAASWDPKSVGMAIEGFRPVPRGSVDWVLRGGAGGRIDERTLAEAERLAVSALGSYYDPVRLRTEENMSTIDYTKMNRDQLAEHMLSEHPDLARALNITKDSPTPQVREEATPAAAGLSLADVQRLLQEQKQELTDVFTSKLEETESAVEERAQEIVEEREHFRGLEKVAHDQIVRAGLGPKWTADLKARYTVLPSGPTPALLVEAADGKSLEEVLREKIETDLTYVRGLLEEATPNPRVRGLGASVSGDHAGAGKAAAKNEFREFMAEGVEGGVKDDDLKSMVSEGIA